MTSLRAYHVMAATVFKSVSVLNYMKIIRFLENGLFRNRGFLKWPSASVSAVMCKTYDQSTTNDLSMKVDSEITSLACKGFLRSLKGYTPLPDVAERVRAIFFDCLGDSKKSENAALMQYDLNQDRLLRYKILSRCVSEFNHDIPNSQLHKINSLEDLTAYFTMPVKSTTTYEDFGRTSDLPPNMHIQQEYVRFHPETDTMFGGISAFPKSSCIVTNLKAKKKYRGFKAPKTWPFEYVP